MFDYRGDKILVDHDSGLGWILLRTEISRRMKSHAVRPCARRRKRGCPFPGPPCRPGRRRTCVYGRNELHPSRHGHLTGLGGVRTPRAEGGAGTSRAGPVMTPRAEAAATSAALPCGVARFHFGTLRREIPLIPTPTAGTWPDRAAHKKKGGGAVVGADVPGGPPSASDCSPARVRPLGAGAAATSAALPCGAARFHFGIVPTG